MPPDEELSVLFACVNAIGRFVCVIWLAETSNREREGAKAVSRASWKIVIPWTKVSKSTYLERGNEVGLVVQEDGALVRADVDVAGFWKSVSGTEAMMKGED